MHPLILSQSSCVPLLYPYHDGIGAQFDGAGVLSSFLNSQDKARECDQGGYVLSVQFSDVSIREFERILGDHPGTREGLSLAIGWN